MSRTSSPAGIGTRASSSISLGFLVSAGFLGLHALATPGYSSLRRTPGSRSRRRSACSSRPSSPPRLSRPRRAASEERPSLSIGPARRAHRADARLGFVSLAGLPPSRAAAGLGGRRAARHPGRRRARPLRLLRVEDPAVPSATRRRARPGHRDRARPARRGDDRDRAQPQLALELVGVAPAHAPRVRGDRRGCRAEYRRSGSLSAAFGGLYLEATLARIDRWTQGRSRPSLQPISEAIHRSDPRWPAPRWCER